MGINLSGSVGLNMAGMVAVGEPFPNSNQWQEGDWMTLYIAAPWVCRDQAIEVAGKFKEAGFDVNSRWFHHEGSATDNTGTYLDVEATLTQALEDYEDVIDADVLVVLNLAKSEGKAVETGIAIATGTPFITIGPRGNIFAVLSEAELDTVEEAIDFLTTYYRERDYGSSVDVR